MTEINWQDWNPENRVVLYGDRDDGDGYLDDDYEAAAAWPGDPPAPGRAFVYERAAPAEDDILSVAERMVEGWAEWWFENMCHGDDDYPLHGAVAADLLPVLRAWAEAGVPSAYLETGEVIVIGREESDDG